MALVIVVGSGGGGGDAVGEPWHAGGAVADGLDVSGGTFTDLSPMGAEGAPIFDDPIPRSYLVGFNILVLSGDDAGLWQVTPAGACIFLEDQPQFSGLVMVTLGAKDGSPRLWVGGNETGNPTTPNTIYVPLGVSLYARTDSSNEFFGSQAVTKEIEVKVPPGDGTDPVDEIVTANLVVNSNKHRAAFLGATAVDFGIVVINSGLFVEEHDPLAGFTGRLGFASYGFSGFTEAFEPIFRWRFGVSEGDTVEQLLSAPTVPLQAGDPEVDDDLTTKRYVDAQIAGVQSVVVPTSHLGTQSVTDTTPFVVPHDVASFEISVDVGDTDILNLSISEPPTGKAAFSILKISNSDNPPAGWSADEGIEFSHNPDLRANASTTYAVYSFGGDNPKFFLSRILVVEPPVVEEPVWQPVIPTDPYGDTVYAADLIANDEPWVIDPALSRHTIQVTESDDVTVWPFNRIPVQVLNPGPHKFVKLAVNIVNANSTNGVSINLLDATTGAPAGGIPVNKQGAYVIDVFGGDPGFVALWAYRVGSSPIS